MIGKRNRWPKVEAKLQAANLMDEQASAMSKCAAELFMLQEKNWVIIRESWPVVEFALRVGSQFLKLWPR